MRAADELICHEAGIGRGAFELIRSREDAVGGIIEEVCSVKFTVSGINIFDGVASGAEELIFGWRVTRDSIDIARPDDVAVLSIDEDEAFRLNDEDVVADEFGVSRIREIFCINFEASVFTGR